MSDRAESARESEPAEDAREQLPHPDRGQGSRSGEGCRAGRDADRRRRAGRQALCLVRLAGHAAALAAVLALGLTQPVSIVGVGDNGDNTCSVDWCQPGATLREAQALIDSQVATVTEGRDCWTPGERDGEIPATVVVKGAKVDKSVAWGIGLDEAFARNRDGDSWNDVIVIVACS